MTMNGEARGKWTVFEAKEGFVVIRLLNPPMNVLTREMRAEIASWIERFNEDDSLRATVLTGEGARGFSAGADLKEFKRLLDENRWREHAEDEHTVYASIADSPKPVIAALHGFVLGGGLELALACDLRIADEETKLGLPEAKIGIFPAGGGTERLPRLIGIPKALELMWLGEPIAAEEALRIGLVNRVVPPGRSLATAEAWAATIAARPLTSIRTIKALVRGGMEMNFGKAESLAVEALGELFRTHDLREGVEAFLEKRSPRFEHR
jgi:enoyl-CoA hydratase